MDVIVPPAAVETSRFGALVSGGDIISGLLLLLLLLLLPLDEVIALADGLLDDFLINS